MMADERPKLINALTLLYTTIGVTIWLHYDPGIMERIFFGGRSYWSSWSNYSSWHSHQYATLQSTVTALFSHADWEHVLGNMFFLWYTGRCVFCYLSCWTNPWSFLWIYFGSQLTAVAGCRLLSAVLELQWKHIKKRGSKEWSFGSTESGLWEWFPNVLVDGLYTVFHLPKWAQLRFWQYVPMLGASAAVFGVAGAHAYTALVSPNHPVRMDTWGKLLWFGRIGMEVYGTPVHLSQLGILLTDDVDHASHVFGFLGGFVLAWIWESVLVRWNDRIRWLRPDDIRTV